MTAGTTKPVRTGHTGLVGLPLVLVMIFCFAFVMVQSHQTKNVQSNADTSDGISSKSTLKSQTKTEPKLSPSSSHPASSLKTAPSGNSSASGDSLNPASQGHSGETSTPQPVGPGVKSLQSALPNKSTTNSILNTVNQANKDIYKGVRTLQNLGH